MRQLQFSHFRQSLLAGACDDGALYTWDTNTKTQLQCFDVGAHGHTAPCTGLVFSPRNQMLLISVGLDANIICYDIVTNKVIESLPSGDACTSVDMMSDGATLVVGSSRGRLSVYDLRNTSQPVRSTMAHQSCVTRLCFSSNSQNSTKVTLSYSQLYHSSQQFSMSVTNMLKVFFAGLVFWCINIVLWM